MHQWTRLSNLHKKHSKMMSYTFVVLVLVEVMFLDIWANLFWTNVVVTVILISQINQMMLKQWFLYVIPLILIKQLRTYKKHILVFMISMWQVFNIMHLKKKGLQIKHLFFQTMSYLLLLVGHLIQPEILITLLGLKYGDIHQVKNFILMFLVKDFLKK